MRCGPARRVLVAATLLVTNWGIPLAAWERTEHPQILSADARPRAGRSVPASHVFVRGDSMVVRVPQSVPTDGCWRLTDDMAQEIAAGQLATAEDGYLELGPREVGWYRVDFLDRDGRSIEWTTGAVLERLVENAVLDSPIGVDAAIAWFSGGDRRKQETFSHLAALSGVGWTRDRLRWREIQPTPDQLVGHTTYDDAASLQRSAGLTVLQVFHDTPEWAVAEPRQRGRFPGDLRHVYELGRAMSQRFRGTVQAWEPWNEPNVATFGGHTFDEICSYQKAAFLGFKAGDPDVTVCWSVTTGVPTDRQTNCVLENETWPYFDTYNLHTYDWPDAYERLWEPARRAACGKPLWVTESDRGMHFDPQETHRDLSCANDRRKAQFLAQSYATSLFAGAARHFHFILGEYTEGPTQFGLLRHDMTPRRGYVALAAIGRLLTDAVCLGRWEWPGRPELHVIAFRGRPDGRPHDVLVAWAEQPVDWEHRGAVSAAWPWPADVPVTACYDYLGRTVTAGVPAELTSSPIFVVLPLGTCERWALRRVATSEPRPGDASPIVLQCLMPKDTSVRVERIEWAWEYEHGVVPGQATDLPLFVYNFSQHEVSGSIAVETLPDGVTIQPDRWHVHLPPMGREPLAARVTLAPQDHWSQTDRWIKLCGQFGDAGQPVLAFRLVPHPTDPPSP